MSRVLSFSIALVLVGVPFHVFAAPLITSDDVMTVLQSEAKPIVFSMTTTHDGFTVNAHGQKEGNGPEKGWVTITTEWKQGGQWMNTEADVRIKGDKAYFRLASVTGSSDAPQLTAFKAMERTWYALDVSLARRWFSLPLESTHEALDLERFTGGYSYRFSAESLATSLPWLAAIQPLRSVSVKIDTNLSNGFQFGNFDAGSVFHATIQRQFHAVYVETPRVTSAPLSEIIQDYFFRLSTHEPVALPVQQSQSSSASSKPLLSKASVTVVPRADVLSQRSALHLHGSNGQDIRVSARIVTSPITWTSLASFNNDFGQGRGILYRYDNPVQVRFSSKGAYAGLDVIFFDKAGRFISSASMPRCQRTQCPTYGPDRPAAFALEVGAGFLRRTKVNSLWRLSLDWVAEPQTGATLQQFGRSSVRVTEQRLQIPAPASVTKQEAFEIDQSFRILAEVTASRFRKADILAASKQFPDETSAHQLYSLLFDVISRNDVRYGFIVVPTDVPDTFQLVLDNYSFAPPDVLDVNNNGTIDADEKPADRGATYNYPLFTRALSGFVFDTSITGEIAVYVPIKDDNGTTIGILALVK